MVLIYFRCSLAGFEQLRGWPLQQTTTCNRQLTISCTFFIPCMQKSSYALLERSIKYLMYSSGDTHTYALGLKRLRASHPSLPVCEEPFEGALTRLLGFTTETHGLLRIFLKPPEGMLNERPLIEGLSTGGESLVEDRERRQPRSRSVIVAINVVAISPLPCYGRRGSTRHQSANECTREP